MNFGFKVRRLLLLLCVGLFCTLAFSNVQARGYSHWQTGRHYNDGDLVAYKGRIYKCIYGHDSLEGWDPADAPSVWKESRASERFYRDRYWRIGSYYRAGDIVTFEGRVYKCRKSHYTRNGYEPFSYRKYWEEIDRSDWFRGHWGWRSGAYYNVGELVTYEGVVYRCRQAHRTQSDWRPSCVPALWEEVDD